ncbi:MAG: hypothetical protein AAGC71_13970 [Pseudomonadota bacterium]
MLPPDPLPQPTAGSDAELIAALLRGNARKRFLAAYGIRHELLTLASASQSVASVKVAWWYDELQRAGHGGARHPLTEVLAGTDPNKRGDWSVFEEYLVLVESWLRGEQPVNLEECRLALFRQYAPSLYWCVDVASDVRAETTGTVHRIAIAAGFADHVVALSSNSTPALMTLPTEWTDSNWPQDSGSRAELIRRCVDAGLRELTFCAAAPDIEATSAVTAALSRGKLHAAQRNRSASRFMQLFRAWRSVRRAHSRTRISDDY